MSVVTATLVKELREKTNAGMMDCKKALEETQGNFDAAIEWLRVKGLSSAAKKAGRIAAEGLVTAKCQNNIGVLVEINSETDFVARNDQFRSFVAAMAEQVWAQEPKGELLQEKYYANPALTVEGFLKENVARIGENIVCRRFERYAGGANTLVHTYVHGEGKIGVLVELEGSGPDMAKSEVARMAAQDICLHVAAMNPMAISSNQIPTAVVEKEKEILKAKNLEQGKRPEMIDKIVEGQIRKFLAENCLLDQAFVKNPDQKISEYLTASGKTAGGALTVKRFVRFELGQGIEKKQVDFAAEVAAQARPH